MGASWGGKVVCTKGRSPFFLLLWCVWQCLWETLRAGKGWPGPLWLPLVLKLGWGEQHLPPRSLSGLLSPGPWGAHCAEQPEQPGTKGCAPRVRACAGAPLQRWPSAAAGKGRPGSTATFPPRQRLLRNTKQFPWDQCPFPPRMSCEQGFPCCHCVPPISS